MRSPNIGPVYFIWVDKQLPPRELTVFLEKNDIILVVAPHSLLLATMANYKGHLTPAASARLLLPAILEKHAVDRFIYLDSDVQVTGSLELLAGVNVPHDHIAVVEEDVSLFSRLIPKIARKLQKRRDDLGMPENTPFFNSGVILARMHPWAKIAGAAQKFYSKNQAVCRTFDQDALNAVCHDRHQLLSPKWNFQPRFFDLGVESIVKRRIVHFVGPYKPWGSVPLSRPWCARKPFLSARSELPQLWERRASQGSPGHAYSQLKKMLRQSFRNSQKERSFFLDYCARTKFTEAV